MIVDKRICGHCGFDLTTSDRVHFSAAIPEGQEVEDVIVYCPDCDSAHRGNADADVKL